jgi:hypothetical protein
MSMNRQLIFCRLHYIARINGGYIISISNNKETKFLAIFFVHPFFSVRLPLTIDDREFLPSGLIYRTRARTN